ncbi:TonB-dependent receptor plug domain-containing protein [Undibacterium crateris]|uniref:TonB-dependent receptor plug domain-containing protein n=1 Tax=Undibacterium crateris TaxID=2528175 RepID=UPI00138996B8|nr:TonB-dependent receptor [Undibacterium crateris]NDI86015.1 TonB-dependent receptor [Undibacterium crateris]
MKLNKITAALATIGMFSTAAFAQAQTQTTEKIQKVEVTGTSIKRTNTETASPVQVIRAADIKRSGATNMSELMQTIPSITSGGQNDFTSGNGFAAGTATASLRGLGSASTLTLINGRRMAATATADPNSGQSTLYNINNIPMSAIERVEVLKDGASAVYGSDAIAGVVNIILKKEYKGLEATATTSGATQGGFKNNNISLFGGYGDVDTDGFNIMVGLDASKREGTKVEKTGGISALPVARGKWGGNIFGEDSAITFTPNYYPETGVGKGVYDTTAPLAPTKCPANQVSTTILQSKAPACAMDTNQYAYFTMPSKSANLFSRASFNVTKDISGFVEAGVSRLENEFPGGGGFATLSSGLSTWFDPSGTRRSFRFALPANHPDNPLFIANSANQLRVATGARLADIAAGTDVTQTTYRLVGGLSGTHFGWDWQSGLMLNKSKRESRDFGAINSITAGAALEKYRFGGVNSAELLKQISPDANSSGETKVNSIDLKGSTEFGQLAGGSIGIAAGAEYRRESIDMVSDANLAAGNYVGRGSSSATGSRNVASLFTEANLPVLKSVNIEAAVRYDRYSDYGSSTTPKIGFKYTPMPELSFRGTVSEGFRAPGLTQISTSNVSSFQTINTNRDWVRCPNGAAIPGATNYESAKECSDGERSIASFIVANTQLKPETSRSKTLGLVFAPTANFSGTLDVYQISRKNEIDRLSSNDILRKLYAEGNTVYNEVVFRSPDPTTLLKDAAGNPIPGTGPVVGVKRKYLNLGESIVKGVDLELAYKANLGAWGRLNTTLFAGYIDSFKYQSEAGLPYVDTSDTGDTPRLKTRLNLSWSLDDYTVFGSMNYTSGYGLPAFNNTTGVKTVCNPLLKAAALAEAPGCRVASFTSFDMGATYTGFKDLTLSATVRNVFDRNAPFDPNYSYYNTVLHNPQGRAVTVSANYKFK